MIHIYPGMGATSSMYGKIWKEEVSGIYHDWPRWKGEVTISDLAERLIAEHNIQDGDVLVGSSLGGIVAGEIAQKRNIDQLVLVGSAASKKEISKILEILHPLINYSPIAFIKACSGKLPSELAQMFSESDPEFIRAMSRAIFSWDGIDLSPKVLRIHGSRDRVIPSPMQIDHWLDGGHLIAITHAMECVAKLKEE